ncbi:MAG TPA: histidine kinase [Deltaproteobacteria bacterium]|nr:MAG: hypothetical protein A2Z79_11210 [Deltaproteobacteria bacterium GWA2_55_82]OGQ63443.1 MAG: hypothetical protein A3I81_05385 [Deltaproteobacteria bacterium RIFCSPLOWO2_02_FULL_55_12]OIJ74824.1 MAG: hypothetical protein A2V21_311450 [Deltaproteobacteria bacterium GWC2_55_46]HBG47531.1 histidine kinase [Deltaproteobacteria bacterium]HCY11547.1 histidine kinase [Deltaproteobacteria bacterium]
MENLSDKELLEVIRQRLEAKDRAYEELRDLTGKLEDLNTKLVESERVKSSFLSNIRNEINNPLTSVLAISELIISGDDEPDYATVRSIIGLIHKEAFNLNFQLRNIFAAAELEAGEAVPGFSGVDVESILNDVAATFAHRASERKVAVRVMPGELSGGVFRTDAEMLHRAVSNLLSNAIEYSPEGGAVVIDVAREEGCLSISVADQGPGIERSKHSSIFSRFKQLDSGSTKRHCGHGLGLSIVKATADLLGGSIEVESDIGEGARFVLRVPEADADMSAGAISMDGAEFFIPAEAERF